MTDEQIESGKSATLPPAAAVSNFKGDFADTGQEWKRLLAEALGTFGLVFVATGGPAISAATGGGITRTAAAIAPGLMVMALIYTLADLSGAHFNPAVTLVFALRRDFPWSRVPGYVLAQVLGAIAAAGVLAALVGTAGGLGATAPAPHVTWFTALAVEVVLTAMLALIVLGTASGAQIVGHNAAIAVGSFIAIAGLLGGPLSGGSMNPARSLASDLVTLHFATTWIYIVGPVVGAAVGVVIGRLLRRHRSDAEIAAAQGFMSEAKRPK